MLWIIEHLVACANLNYIARIHYGYSVGDVGHNAKIVRDVYCSKLILLLHLFDKVQYLRLYRHVQCRCRLVAYQYTRVAGYCNSYYHPLAHSAAEFVRILLISPFGVYYANVLQYLYRFFMRFLAIKILVQVQRFLYLPANGFQRVKAGHGVLHYHGYFLAAYFAPFLVRFQRGKIPCVLFLAFRRVFLWQIIYVSAVYPAVFIQKTVEILHEHALAGAGLAHYRKAFAFIKVQRYSPEGVELLPSQAEFYV